MILDTSFLVDLLRNNHAAVSKITEIEKQNEPVATTTVSVFEIWQGLPKKSKEQQIEKTIELFKSINVLNLDFDSAIEAGNIQRKLTRAGQKIEPQDAMIAGIAKTRRQKVLTRNIKHFERINDLEVESY